MTTAYPSPGIIPAEIAGPEFWRPTTYRVRFEDQPDDLPTYTVICIARLGEDYGSKGAPVPTCDEHDAAGLVVWETVIPAHTTAVAVAATYPGMAVARRPDGSFAFHGGSIGGGGASIETPGIPGRELSETPPVAPVPLPAGGLLLICAVVALAVKGMRR